MSNDPPGQWLSHALPLLEGEAMLGAEPVLGVHAEACVASTQDVARALASEGHAGIAVFAERQTAGRGRMGRVWEDPRGLGVAMSIALDAHSMPAEEASLRAGLAACLACEAAISEVGAAVAIGLRWPNDVVLDRSPQRPRIGRKVAGVLIESGRLPGGTLAWIVGIGINVRQQDADWGEELRGSAVSLSGATGKAVEPVAVAVALLRGFRSAWGTSTSSLTRAWHARNLLLGEVCVFEVGGGANAQRVVGVVEELDPGMRIVVRLADGRRREMHASTTTLRHDLAVERLDEWGGRVV